MFRDVYKRQLVNTATASNKSNSLIILALSLCQAEKFPRPGEMFTLIARFQKQTNKSRFNSSESSEDYEVSVLRELICIRRFNLLSCSKNRTFMWKQMWIFSAENFSKCREEAYKLSLTLPDTRLLFKTICTPVSYTHLDVYKRQTLSCGVHRL